MTGIIYQHLNTVNGKCYIGQTIKSMDKRWKKHLKDTKKGSDCIFHQAIRKYGESVFEHKILCEIYRDTIEQLEEALDYYECYYIKFYDSYNHGYNMTLGGGGTLGYKTSEETRQKQSESRKGELGYFYGKHHSEETKKILSEAAKLRYQGQKNPFYGKHHSDESKQKMSKAKIGKKMSEETKSRLSQAKKGKPLSEEHRKNLATANHARQGIHCHSEEQKQKWSRERKGKYTGKSNPFYGKQHTEETKAKISKIHKGKKNESQCKKVLCIDTGVIYDSLIDAAKANNINISNLSKACRSNGKNKCGKKYWSYNINQ